MINDLPAPLPLRATAVEMPPSELAGALLAYLEQTERNGRFHRGNILNRFQEAHGRELAQAMSEAWAWLEREVLISHPSDNPEAGVFMLSRMGHASASPEAFARFRQATLLPRAMLHPKIAERAWLVFVMGDYDTAVFAAFKAVEVEVARKSGCPEHGVPLMRAAFHKISGPLRDVAAPDGEKEGRQQLFAGAFATFRNPPGHRNVTYSNPNEPAEQMIVASHLMRIVDGIDPIDR